MYSLYTPIGYQFKFVDLLSLDAIYFENIMH